LEIGNWSFFNLANQELGREKAQKWKQNDLGKEGFNREWTPMNANT